MNEFGQIADDLTFLEERLDAPDLQPYAAALKRRLHRAFVEACKACREMRAAEAKTKGFRPRELTAAPLSADARVRA